MTTTTACPSCSRQLRVPEDLLGRLVKCPSCSHTFTAEASGAVEESETAADPSPMEAPLPTTVPRSREEPESRRRRPGDAEDDDGDDDYDDRPRRRRRKRGDYVPHRGSTILVLGILSLVLGIVGIVLGPMAWSMGNNDLREMRAGRMDPEGEGSTNAGRVCGIIATIKDRSSPR
jgi:predicted Zn finger-like uncharacterized protein